MSFFVHLNVRPTSVIVANLSCTYVLQDIITNYDSGCIVVFSNFTKTDFSMAGSSVHVQDVSRPLHGHTPKNFRKDTVFGLPTTRAKNRNQNLGRKKNTGIVLTLGRSGHYMGRFFKIEKLVKN